MRMLSHGAWPQDALVVRGGGGSVCSLPSLAKCIGGNRSGPYGRWQPPPSQLQSCPAAGREGPLLWTLKEASSGFAPPPPLLLLAGGGGAAPSGFLRGECSPPPSGGPSWMAPSQPEEIYWGFCSLNKSWFYSLDFYFFQLSLMTQGHVFDKEAKRMRQHFPFTSLQRALFTASRERRLPSQSPASSCPSAGSCLSGQLLFSPPPPPPITGLGLGPASGGSFRAPVGLE